MKMSIVFRRLLFLGAILSVGLLPAQCQVLAETVTIQDEKYGDELGYDDSPQTEIISLQHIVSELAQQDSEPRLRVYGNGTVIVHFPSYMKKAGNYHLQLSRREMAELFQAVLESSVLNFDAPWVTRRKAEIEKQRQTRSREKGEPVFIREVADADITHLTFRLKWYRPEGAKAQALINVLKKVTYRNLRADAEQYPEISALARLASLEARLTALIERDDLVKIDE